MTQTKWYDRALWDWQVGLCFTGAIATACSGLSLHTLGLAVMLFGPALYLGVNMYRRAQRRYEAWERAYRLSHSEQVRAAAENIYQVTRAMFRVTRDGGAGR